MNEIPNAKLDFNGNINSSYHDMKNIDRRDVFERKYSLVKHIPNVKRYLDDNLVSSGLDMKNTYLHNTVKRKYPLMNKKRQKTSMER